MPRRTSPRKISFLPDVTYFKPAGIKMAVLEEVKLGHDEVEAIRLKHLEKLDQEAAARQMGVSQPTFHRLLSSAHEKLAEAVIKGKALRIEGGNVTVQEDFQAASCEKSRDCGRRLRNRATGSSNQPTPREGRKVIVVASVDGTLQGPVDERFGRCRKLIVYDPETRTVSVVDNQTNKAVAQGAGIDTSQSVVAADAKTVIGGHFGPRAFQVLDAAGIDIFTATNMTVAEAIEHFEQGLLRKLSGPDVNARW